MSHRRSLDFNEVTCTENKENEQNDMSDREKERTGSGLKAY